ncbi:MAG: 3'-5' exonuclease, partial [Anaerolineae bacterium]|nr:3'-5' exonuclease [Anaerolineae bacterium]
LTGQTGTWVRVGDPNQAIYETFTTADPENLRRFMANPTVKGLPMPESGRSTQSIIDLANRLIDWTMGEHPQHAVRDALDLPHIQPTAPDDPQANPPDRPDQIYFFDKKFQPQQEIQTVVKSVSRWLAEDSERTVAILDARNKRGVDIANMLRRANVPYVELLNSTATTRSTAGVLSNVLKYLARPEEARQLATVFHVWKRHDWDLEDLQPVFEWVEKVLQDCPRVEDYLWPRPGQDWLENQAELNLPVEAAEVPIAADDEADFAGQPPEAIARQLLLEFKIIVRRWQEAAILPIDQLILLLAQDLFDNEAELALAHKFAVVLRRTAAENPAYRLPDFVEVLAEVARNQRRFLGFDEDAIGFEPPPGKVTVSTMHRAKGLEWDRVYLMGLNNYSFPSGEPQDSYFSEKWFVRDSLNLEAEILGQLAALIDNELYTEGLATEQARLDLVRERLRLLFVGLTRAKQELVVTWNRGRQQPGKPDNQPAIPFVALEAWNVGRRT